MCLKQWKWCSLSMLCFTKPNRNTIFSLNNNYLRVTYNCSEVILRTMKLGCTLHRISSLLQQIFIECLLWDRPHFNLCKCNSNIIRQNLCPHGAYVLWKETENSQELLVKYIVYYISNLNFKNEWECLLKVFEKNKKRLKKKVAFEQRPEGRRWVSKTNKRHNTKCKDTN